MTGLLRIGALLGLVPMMIGAAPAQTPSADAARDFPSRAIKIIVQEAVRWTKVFQQSGIKLD